MPVAFPAHDVEPIELAMEIVESHGAVAGHGSELAFRLQCLLGQPTNRLGDGEVTLAGPGSDLGFECDRHSQRRDRILARRPPSRFIGICLFGCTLHENVIHKKRAEGKRELPPRL